MYCITSFFYTLVILQKINCFSDMLYLKVIFIFLTEDTQRSNISEAVKKNNNGVERIKKPSPSPIATYTL